MNKKTKLAIIGVIALVLVTIGITYAYWLITRTQTGENVISTGCLDIALSGTNDISLTNQFPITDAEGAKLTPYEFTVINNCNTSVDYQVALEALETGAEEISSKGLKVALDEYTPMLLSQKVQMEPTIEGAYESRSLITGTLTAASSATTTDQVTYKLRLWIDENASMDEMNKSYKGKISVTVGQGINNPIKEGTLAYNILSSYNGAGSIMALDSEIYPESTSLQVNKSSSIWYGTNYKLSSSGNFELVGDLVQATAEECRAGQKSDGTAITCGKYTLNKNYSDNYYDSPTTSNTLYEITSLTDETQSDTDTHTYYRVNKYVVENDYTQNITSENVGIYKIKDDLGDSYYYRGNPTNNYVKMFLADEYTYNGYVGCYNIDFPESCVGGPYKTKTECERAYKPDSYETWNACVEQEVTEPKEYAYWRITRINGDGTIRLVYDGEAAYGNGVTHKASIGSDDLSNPSKFNTSYSDAKYGGYTYDNSATDKTQIDSAIKKEVDAWYNEYLKDKYSKYIADGIFCNDREVESYEYLTKAENNYSVMYTTQDNAAYTVITYNALEKLAPNLTCAKEDRYSVNKNIGNGLLTNPIGLLTVDEYVLAGANADYSNPNNHYLKTEHYTFTATPYKYEYANWATPDNMGMMIWMISPEGIIGPAPTTGYTGSHNGVRPVINLKADVEFTGTGEVGSPYEIVME